MGRHILPTKMIKFAMSVRSRKHAPIIRHCWAVRMVICLIKSNTDKQQCLLPCWPILATIVLKNTILTLNYKHQSVHFDWPGLTTVRRDGVWQDNKSSAASGAKMARGAYGALGLGHWLGLNRDVHNLWPDTGQYILEKNQCIWNNRQDLLTMNPLKKMCDLFTCLNFRLKYPL